MCFALAPENLNLTHCIQGPKFLNCISRKLCYPSPMLLEPLPGYRLWTAIFLLLLTANLHSSEEASPSRGKLAFFQKYSSGVLHSSCNDCHHVTENRYHDLHIPPTYDEMRYFLDSFRSRGLTQRESNCRSCHQISPSHLLHRGRITPHLQNWFQRQSSSRLARFKKASSECLQCHKLDQKHYFRAIKPGPPLHHSYFRSSLKGVSGASMENVILDCMNRYQLRHDENQAKDLAAFIRTISSPEQKDPHPYAEIPRRLPLNLKANLLNGKTIYEFSCKPCHQEKRITLFENVLSREGIFRKLRGMELARRKRIKKLDGVQIKAVPDLGLPSDLPSSPVEQMPLFREERLSDQELIDVAEYIVQKQRGL